MTVGWLAGIPPHWQALPLRYVAEPLGGLTFGPEDVSDAETGTLVLRSSNIQDGTLDLTDQLYVDAHIPSRMRLQPGDILVCSRNGSRALIGKNAAIPPELEGQTFGAFMTVLRSGANDFLYWVLNSPLFEQQSATFLTSTINQLTLGNFKSFTVPYPPEDERRRIADFLDRETAQIDELIGKQERLIELLAEKRQAIITHAVTKGLDPDALTKPSGVPWLGDVPAHWATAPLKWVSRLTTGMTPSTANENNFPVEPTPYPWIRPEDLDESGRPSEASKFLSLEAWIGSRPVGADSVLICCIGATLGKVGLIEASAATNQQITAVESDLSGSYLFGVLGAARREIEAMSVGNTLPILNTSRLGMLRIPVPPTHEQLRIARHIAAKSGIIDRLSLKCRSAISLLRERRAALISAAVTGKIKVEAS